MRTDIEALKAAVPLRDVVLETHDPNRLWKVICPFHHDIHPSCHIYPSRFKCFACGAHGDVLDWLEQIHGLNRAEAIRELKRRAGGYIYVPSVVRRPVKVETSEPTFKPVDADVLKAHCLQAEALDHVPLAIQGRGFTLDELRALNFAAYGDDAVFPIRSPNGSVLALKRRYSEPYKGQRYLYTTPRHGCPAWCSPGFSERDEILVVEGELNGMACFLARSDLAVMGAAGANGPLHPQTLKGRTVYVYADGDEPGRKARERWSAQALETGAAKVFILDPWPMDACDLVGREGRDALRERLI